jgi:ApeA N-terminal domain 1
VRDRPLAADQDEHWSMSHDVRRAFYAGSVSEKDRAALLAGEAVVGQFQVAGTDNVVPGVLRWSAESGATLELIDDASGFPRTFAVPRFHVYGVLRHGAEVTLHDCLLRRLAFVDQPTHVSASTLAFGAHVLPQTTWPHAIYSTAALSEWRNDSGMHFSKPAPRKRPSDFHVEFKQPARDLVTVPGGELAFTGNVATSSIGHRPDFWMRTTAVMVMDVTRPQTISALTSRYAQPLRTLMALAADQPERPHP